MFPVTPGPLSLTWHLGYSKVIPGNWSDYPISVGFGGVPSVNGGAIGSLINAEGKAFVLE